MSHRRGRAAPVWIAAAALGLAACCHPSRVSQQASASPPGSAATHPEAPEVLFYNGLMNQWLDWGWSPPEVSGPGPAKVDSSTTADSRKAGAERQVWRDPFPG